MSLYVFSITLTINGKELQPMVIEWDINKLPTYWIQEKTQDTYDLMNLIENDIKINVV